MDASASSLVTASALSPRNFSAVMRSRRVSAQSSISRIDSECLALVSALGGNEALSVLSLGVGEVMRVFAYQCA
jgi:hypothetical protein